MPGQYFAYVPFEAPGDLDAAIKAWIQRTNAMAYERDINRGLAKTLSQAQSSGKQGEIDEAALKLQDFAQRASKDKHGDIGLDRRKVPIRLNHYDGGRPLAELAGHQPFSYTLYIVGHCTNGCETIFNTSPRYKETEEIKADVLVRRMVADGLPKDTFNIKLLSCYGAAGWGNQPSFLDRLADQLKAHCPRLYLRGYKEPVMLGQFYQGDQQRSKKAALLPGGRVDLAKPLPGSLKDTARALAVGREDWPQCAICGKPSRFKCGNCDNTFYCSKLHLQQDRTAHYPDQCLD